jgi:hypothetical protein
MWHPFRDASLALIVHAPRYLGDDVVWGRDKVCSGEIYTLRDRVCSGEIYKLRDRVCSGQIYESTCTSLAELVSFAWDFL